MSKDTLMRFEHDRWLPVKATQLAESDLVYVQGRTITLSAPPAMVDGKLQFVPSEIAELSENLVIAIGDEWMDREHICMVMDYASAGCNDYGDGTYMIAELEDGPGAIYSPRLPAKDLEAWCKKHIDRFEEFFTKHEAKLDRGEIVKMVPWWF